ncbi:MAG: CRISPR-associated endonuclease Cas2 [candidate division WOR-3 bacterium]|nr:CRISPR-associated endonuclease Cas2 [candidate division WOR-3 bacterium]MCX7837737.1 CRISPR-associated endonuclease Cas2 [candidate division WOR-3 bacterium]MDW8114489.1 CRISPR-associated endonuclease Cas2 [candidate division WOR-3 bacterium]
MKVILIYDISLIEKKDQKRLVSVMKICRRYLHHIQKSVFEGELTEAKLRRLEYEILNKVDMNRDSVIIYTFPESVMFQRKILTNIKDPTDNIT